MVVIKALRDQTKATNLNKSFNKFCQNANKKNWTVTRWAPKIQSFLCSVVRVIKCLYTNKTDPIIENNEIYI